MRLYGLRIWVDDLDTAKRFYGGKLGLKELWDWGPAVGYALGDATLIVELDDPDERLAGRFVGCSIQVDDIDATHRDLAAKGVEFASPPERKPWGGALAHFKDPSGNVLTLLG